jgi:diacylglycerol kinase (ATP)
MLALTNALAGRTEREAVDAVLVALRAGGDQVELAECDEDTKLDQILDHRRGRTLVVIGGDGSLHSTVRALWRRGEAADCVVGLVPLGTGNDFARGVGIPLDPAEAARLVVEGTPSPVDLITDEDGGVVVNAVHVGVGADAAVAARPLKSRLKIAAFPIGGLIAGLRAKGLRLRVDVDGSALWRSGRRRVLMAGVANAPSIAGGTATFGPDAVVTDGLFDVTVSLAVGPLARIGYAINLIRGTHPGRADVIHRRARTFTINGDPFHTNADGEIAGPYTRRSWTIRPAAWRCILPPS